MEKNEANGDKDMVEDEFSPSANKVICVEPSTALTLTPAINGNVVTATTESARSLPSHPLIRVKKDLVPDAKNKPSAVSNPARVGGSNLSRHIRILKRRVPQSKDETTNADVAKTSSTTTTIALGPVTSAATSLTSVLNTSITTSTTAAGNANSKRPLRLVPVSFSTTGPVTTVRVPGTTNALASTSKVATVINTSVCKTGSNIVLKPRSDSRLEATTKTNSLLSAFPPKSYSAIPESESVSKSRLFDLEVDEQSLQKEVAALDWLARKKEEEWDAIIRLQKQKEEQLLKLQRRRSIVATQSSSAASVLHQTTKTYSKIKRPHAEAFQGTNGCLGQKNNDINSDQPMCMKCEAKSGSFLCAGCDKAVYCSTNCQALDWEKHSSICGEQ